MTAIPTPGEMVRRFDAALSEYGIVGAAPDAAAVWWQACWLACDGRVACWSCWNDPSPTVRDDCLAGNYGTATAGNNGTATAGRYGTATAGDPGTLVLRHWDGHRYRLVVGYVGENGIRPNTPYRLNAEGKFEEAK